MATIIGVSLFGIKLVGINEQNLQKLLLTLILLVLLLLLSSAARGLLRLIWRTHPHTRAQFWSRQGISLTVALVFILGVVSIWFNDPTRLATALGLVSAGLAFALQKVVTSIAGYFVILRGRTFNVGDRITMGGVRGDVIALGFIQTTLMEMGQPPSVQSASPAVWVRSRQYTGRIVTVSNDKIFDEPVYNYTRDFPFLWEEISLPIAYEADRDAAERILQECAARHTVAIQEMGEEARTIMQQRYGMHIEDFTPKVFYRITDNWLELTVRFMVRDHGIRDLKDVMSRSILKEFEAAGISIASATYDIVGFPPLRLQRDRRETKAADRG